jgi:high-affinity nickel-transport protein
MLFRSHERVIKDALDVFQFIDSATGGIMSSNSSSFGISAISRVFNDSSSDVRGKVAGIYTFLAIFNIAAWTVALITFARVPALLGLAVIAYTFGLRHSVDADHISAIDNVTRKLMQESKKPVAVGFFFSLGHSTVVIGLTVAIAIAAVFIKNTIPSLQAAGGLIGTSVSAAFLLLIAFINALVLWEIFQAFRKVKNGGEYNDQTLDEFLNQRGLMGRFFKPLLRIVGSSWNMYPIGVLFGLGFDTATEVGLLGIVGIQAGKGLPIWAILIFPALFTAGMCLLDTTDGVLMLGAYGWAFVKPVRKLYYNMNITFISVLVALVVGAIEVLSIVQSQTNVSGPFWDAIGNLSNNFGVIGGIIIGLFILSWLISTLIYKVRKYDDIEVKMAPKPGI